MVTNLYSDSQHFEQIPITVLGHPACAGKMTFQGLASALWFLGGVDAEHDARHLLLTGPLGIGVEKANIRDEVLFVVFRHLIGLGNLVGYDRIHLGFAAHWRPPPLERS